ncbi:hypothetical protein TL16_g06565 [Triparma laevis f. inornata]|uniref:Uncharacterized protein n=1 Tax=Triparma laevis f. inornata TaxID=1714386 RepID=A0A9W7EFN4_9STRA|nr:hypothetical protein TL16_g06565 [Triparma laevis f. inornata]
MKKRQIFWLCMDALSALADQSSDIFMLTDYYTNDDIDFFVIGLIAMIFPVLVMGGFIIFSYNDEPWWQICTNLIPGVNTFVNAGVALKEDDPKSQAFSLGRFLEALLEAGPQTLLQAFVALRRPEGLNLYVLYPSLVLSLFSVSKTLVTVFVNNNVNNKSKLEHYPTKVRVFLLGLSFTLCEMVSRVFSIALLGYFCGGAPMAGLLGGETVFLGLWTWKFYDYSNWVMYSLMRPITSFGCLEDFTYKHFLGLRLFVLAVYAVMPFLVRFEGVELIESPDDGIPAFFFGAMVISTTLWVLLMPAFVNTVDNLEINLVDYTPDRFTDCRHPLEVKKPSQSAVNSREGICGCLCNPRVGEVAEEVSDVATMV